jgi:CRISPR system Cascade subunit CasE
MYLSRLFLNLRNAQVRSELARPFEMHRTLLRAFPTGISGIERNNKVSAGILFRVDENPTDNNIVILVQSRVLPDWSFLVSHKDVHGHEYLLPTLITYENKPNPSIMEFDLRLLLTTGRKLAFRLRANPTKRLGKSAGDDQGKRVGIYTEDELVKWLRGKLEGDENRKPISGGFKLTKWQISRDEKIENPKAIYHDEQSHDLKLFTVQFDGVIQVVDPVNALNSISNGIGSAKGFGFGLLSVAPYRGM